MLFYVIAVNGIGAVLAIAPSVLMLLGAPIIRKKGNKTKEQSAELS
jgi:hypothetical protein